MKTIKKLVTLLICIASFSSFTTGNNNIISHADSLARATTNETYTIPIVTTTPATNVTATTATLGGNATDDGGFTITERGILYSTTNNNPEIGDTDVTIEDNGTGTGVFTEDFTGFTANTIYYYRAYAINSDGTSYGDVKSFPNNALNFQSSGSNLVSIPDNAAFDFSSGFTMEAWIKPTAFTTSRTVFSQYSSGQRAFAIITKDVGSVEVTISTNGSDEVYYITANALTLDTWQHIAVTYDNTSIKFYINGIEAGINGSVTGTLSGAMYNSTADILLGSRSSAIFYEGDMDEVRIWTKALTVGEIIAQKDSEIPTNSIGLAAYYKMDQGIAGGDNTAITTLTDSGVNGLNGTLMGFTKTGTTSNFVEGVPSINNNTLGVNEFNAREMPIIYPNPVNDGIINVKISNTLLVNNKKLTYKVYNTVGRIIKEGLLTDVENQISIGYLASGIYMVKISNNENAVVKKLVVK